MRILYLNAIEGNAGWGAEVFVERGFRRNGHTPVSVDFRRYRAQLTKKIRAVGDCDVVFLQRGDHFPVSTLRAIQRPRVFWATELLARRTDQDALLRSECFEHVFVHSVACKKTLIGRGWQQEDHISVLLNGFDEDLHMRNIEAKKEIDVLFVGNMTRRRSALLEKLGAYVKVTHRNAYGKEMVDLFNRARIVLNIHAEDALDTETRIFEALGSGAFVLTERLSTESPFEDGRQLVEADSVDDLIEKALYFLREEDERTTIARQGYEEAQAKHTYTHRAEEIAQVLSKAIGAYEARHSAGGGWTPDEDELSRHSSPASHSHQTPMLHEALARDAARIEPLLAGIAKVHHTIARARGFAERKWRKAVSGAHVVRTFPFVRR